MKKIIFLILAGFLLPQANATVEIIETDSYAVIKEGILEYKKDFATKDVLLAFDLDETVLVVEECLDPAISQGFIGWLRTAHECPAGLTEDRVKDDIKDLQAEKFATLALTARAENLMEATTRELRRNGVSFSGKPFKASANFEQQFTKRSKVVFKNGVTFASGKNKGEVMKILNTNLPRSFDQIIFIDDGIKNVRAMKKAYEEDPNVHVRIYHYTRYNEPEVAE